MFDSLSEQIKQDEAGQVKTGEVVLRWVVVILVAMVFFSGLYVAVRTLG
jgi:hypothetical protein